MPYIESEDIWLVLSNLVVIALLTLFTSFVTTGRPNRGRSHVRPRSCARVVSRARGEGDPISMHNVEDEQHRGRPLCLLFESSGKHACLMNQPVLIPTLKLC